LTEPDAVATFAEPEQPAVEPLENDMRTASPRAGIYLEPRQAEIREARHGRQFRAIAAAAGCSASVLCEIETGVQRRVSADLAHRLEAALDAPRGSLFHLAPADAELLRPYLIAQPA
jgi:hypothetical protein